MLLRAAPVVVVDPFGVTPTGGWDSAAPIEPAPAGAMTTDMGTIVVTAPKPVDWVTWALLAALAVGLAIATRREA